MIVRIAELNTMSDEELQARRAALAEALDPLWQSFDMVEDEIHRRQRRARRERMLAAALEESESTPVHPAASTAQHHD